MKKQSFRFLILSGIANTLYRLSAWANRASERVDFYAAEFYLEPPE